MRNRCRTSREHIVLAAPGAGCVADCIGFWLRGFDEVYAVLSSTVLDVLLQLVLVPVLNEKQRAHETRNQTKHGHRQGGPSHPRRHLLLPFLHCPCPGVR